MEQVQLCYERIQYSHRVDLTHIPVMLLCGIGLFEVVLHYGLHKGHAFLGIIDGWCSLCNGLHCFYTQLAIHLLIKSLV